VICRPHGQPLLLAQVEPHPMPAGVRLRPLKVPINLEKNVIASLSLILTCTGFDGTFVFCTNSDSKATKCSDVNIPLLQEHRPVGVSVHSGLCDQKIWSVPRESALSKVRCSASMKCNSVCIDSKLIERTKEDTRKGRSAGCVDVSQLFTAKGSYHDGKSGDSSSECNLAPLRHGKSLQTQECTDYGSVEGWI